ncbi:MAG: ABC transporter ATP-binding protein [Hydrogeniiclostridium sp.]
MNPVFECRHLTKAFPGKEALHDVSFSLEEGRIVGLLGPNGSGKSTLMKLANGLLSPTQGGIFIDGMAPGVETKKIVSYLPDKNYLNDWMSVRQLVNFFGDFYEDFQKEAAVEMIQRLGIPMHAKLKTLSKGTKEKVQLILVMSRKARLYLLDEPIGGVDPAARDYILHTIISNYSENATVVISTHLISDVESILDQVLFISEGKILLDSPVDELREKNNMSVDAWFREVFKC